jgi:protein TonB
MSTEILSWSAQARIDSPWRRLCWTLPLALLICVIAFVWFAYSMRQPSVHTSEATPINAELIELPAPAQPVSPQPAVTRTVARPIKQPDIAPPVRAEPPDTTTATPTASPPPAAPLAAAQAAPAVQAETRGVKSIFQPLPVIPDELRQDAMNESAVARFQIAADGTTTVELIRPTQNPRLNRLLLDTLRNWRFAPAMQDGKPVASTKDQVIRVNVR